MTKEYELLCDVKLSKLEHINVGELLGAILLHEKQGSISVIKSVKELLLVIFMHQSQIVCNRSHDILFFFTPSYAGRQAYYNDFKNVLGCAKKYTSFLYKREFKFRINNLKKIFLWLIWMKELRAKDVGFAYRMHLANAVLSAYIYVDMVDDYFVFNNICPKLGVTFCDVHPVDYLVTNYLNKRGIVTATLQHAVFEHDKFGWANTFSHSTYFLGISEVARYEAKLSGADISKFLILGPMKYIENPIVKGKKYTGNIAGLALSGPSFEEQNKELLKCALELSNLYGYTFVVRAHPALELEKYKKYFNEKIHLDDSDTMDIFAYKCDFVIMGSSNTFGDILVTSTYAFRMVKDVDFYSCIDEFKFSDVDELKTLVNEFKNNRDAMELKLQEVKQMVCPSGNIKEAYCKFFEKYN